MDVDLKKQMAEAEEVVRGAKDQKFRFEALLSTLESQEQSIVAELQQRGLDPDQLDSEIDTRTQRAQELLQRIRQLVPTGAPSAPASTHPSAARPAPNLGAF